VGAVSGDSSGALEAVLADVRTRIQRVGPEEAARIQSHGGLLIDTRPIEQRADEGVIPGALVIDRNVLEWRLDPTGPHRHPDAGPPGRELVVFCQEGYASSLAVDGLVRLGMAPVSDLEGGFAAWKAAGLPVLPGPSTLTSV
jgi:rhodanese-related sulfurtransferase